MSRRLEGSLFSIVLFLACVPGANTQDIPPDEHCLLQVSSDLRQRSSKVHNEPTPPQLDGETSTADGWSFDWKWPKGVIEYLSPYMDNAVEDEIVPLPESAKLPLHSKDKDLEPDLDKWEPSDTVLLVSAAAVLLLFDIVIVNRSSSDSWACHISLLGLMMVLSVAYLALVCIQRGATDGKAWAVAYILEFALSMDNLFAFVVIFRMYNIQGQDLRWALSVGIYGAMLLRLPFILLFLQVLKLHEVVSVTVGTILVVLGLLALEDGPDEDGVQNMGSARVLKWSFGSRYVEPWQMEEQPPKSCLFYADVETGHWRASSLFMATCLISVVDLFFALDSTGAKTGSVPNRYINLSSSLMAIYTLRAFFFIIRKMDQCFDMVKYGACLILVLVGVQMMTSKWTAVPLGTNCLIITGIFISSVAASWLKVFLCWRKGTPAGETFTNSTEDPAEVEPICNPTTAQGSTGGGADDEDHHFHGQAKMSGWNAAAKRSASLPQEEDDKWSVLDTPRHLRGGVRVGQRTLHKSSDCVVS